jgi:hypothetical protein
MGMGNYHHMRDCVLPVGVKNTPRRSYLALRESPVEVRYHVRGSLEELANKASEFLAD